MKKKPICSACELLITGKADRCGPSTYHLEETDCIEALLADNIRLRAELEIAKTVRVMMDDDSSLEG